MKKTSTRFSRAEVGQKKRPGIIPGLLFLNILIAPNVPFHHRLRILNRRLLRKDVNHHHRHPKDDNFRRLPKDASRQVKGSTGFSESFAPAFRRGCGLPVVDSGSESQVWRYSKLATRLCSAFVANCCLVEGVDIYCPAGQSI